MSAKAPDGGQPPQNPFRKGRPAQLQAQQQNPFRKGRESRPALQNSSNNPSPPSVPALPRSSIKNQPQLPLLHAAEGSSDYNGTDMELPSQDTGASAGSPAKRQRGTPASKSPTTSPKHKKAKTYTSPLREAQSCEAPTPMDTSPVAVIDTAEVVGHTLSLSSSPTKRNNIMHGAFVDSSEDEDGFVGSGVSAPKLMLNTTPAAPEPIERPAESIFKSPKKGQTKTLKKQPAPANGPAGSSFKSPENAASTTLKRQPEPRSGLPAATEALVPPSVSASSSSRGASRSLDRSTSHESTAITDQSSGEHSPPLKKPKFTSTNWNPAPKNDAAPKGAIPPPSLIFPSAQPTQPSGPPHDTLLPRFASLDCKEIYNQLSSQTLALRTINQAPVASKAPIPRQQYIKNGMIQSVNDYLEAHGGITEANLADKLAAAQAKRIKPKDQSRIQKMIDEANRRLTLPPNESKELPSIADTVPPEAEWKTIKEMSRSGSDARLRKLSDSRLVSYRIAKLISQDTTRMSTAQVAMNLIKQRDTPVTEEMKKAKFVRREAGEAEYKKMCTSVTLGNVFLSKEGAPLSKLAAERAEMIRTAKDIGFIDEPEDDLIRLPTLSASSSCRAKKRHKMVHVVTVDENGGELDVLAQNCARRDAPSLSGRRLKKSLQQYDGPGELLDDASMADSVENLEDALGTSDKLEHESALLSTTFKPFGQALLPLIIINRVDGLVETHAAGPGKLIHVAWPQLPLADSEGKIIKIGDVRGQDDMEVDASTLARGNLSSAMEGIDKSFSRQYHQEGKEETSPKAVKRPDNVNVNSDKTTSQLSTRISANTEDEYDDNPTRVDEEIAVQINELLHAYGEGNQTKAPHHSPDGLTFEQAKNKEDHRLQDLEQKRIKSCNSLKALIVHGDWQDVKTLSALQQTITKAFPLPPPPSTPSKPRVSAQYKVACAKCGRKGHRTMKCRAEYDTSESLNAELSRARAANIRQKENNARARLSFGFDGTDDYLPMSPNKAQLKENVKPTLVNGSLGAVLKSSNEALPAQTNTSSMGADLAAAAAAALMLGGQGDFLPDAPLATKTSMTEKDEANLSEDNNDVEMKDAIELPFPSLEEHESEVRQDSPENQDFMDEVEAQLRSELQQDIESQSPNHQASSLNIRLASVLHTEEHLLVLPSIEDTEPALPMMKPLSSSQLKKGTVSSTPTLREPSPDPIDAAGAEAFGSARATPQANPFRSQTANPNELMSDDDDEPIMFTPLPAKTKATGVNDGGGVAGVGVSDAAEDDNTADLKDDDADPELPKRGKSRKSLAFADADSNGKATKFIKSAAEPTRRSTRKSLTSDAREVPQTSDVEAPQGDTTTVKTNKTRKSKSSADSRLVANQAILEPEESETSTKPKRPVTRQSTGASESRAGTPVASKSAEMNKPSASSKLRRNRTTRSSSRADGDLADISENEEVFEPTPSKAGKKQASRYKDVDSDDAMVIDSIESESRSATSKSKGKLPAKRPSTRSRTNTPRAKSATVETSEKDSEADLFYKPKSWLLPVEVGDRVLRLFTDEDTKLYSKADEFDIFDGPWVVTEIKSRLKDKALLETAFDEGLPKHMKRNAFQESLTAKIKLNIPQQAQDDGAKPWVQLGLLVPVLDPVGIKEGSIGPAYPYVEGLDSYKSVVKRLEENMDTGGSTNVFKKKEPRSEGEDIESSLGLVEVRKNTFIAVIDFDPNWTQDDAYEVEKIRKKRLKLVWRSNASEDDLAQEDTDKWQAILKHKVGDALKNYVVVVQWFVHWAGWPLASCTWEPRASFQGNTMVADHYNKHLDVFRDTPIEANYPLQFLFDFEDDDIEKVRRAVMNAEQEKRRPPPKAKPRRRRGSGGESDSSEARRTEARRMREKKLAATLFNSDDEGEAARPKLPKTKRRPQLDDEDEPAPGKEKEAEAEDDWVAELFGSDGIDVPMGSSPAAKPPSQPAQMAQMMQPRGSQLGTASPKPHSSTPGRGQSSLRSMSYSVPPMSNEKVAGRLQMFGTYKTPEVKTPEAAGSGKSKSSFHSLYDISPETRRRAVPIPYRPTATSAPPTSAGHAQVKISSSQRDGDGDVAMGSLPEKKESSDVPIADIPAVTAEVRESTEVVEQFAQERLFVLQEPVNETRSTAQHAEVGAEMSVGPDGEVKVEKTQKETVTVEEEATKVPTPKYRY